MAPQGCITSGGVRGESLAFPGPVFRGCLSSLAHSPLGSQPPPPSSAPIAQHFPSSLTSSILPSLPLRSSCFPVLRILVTTWGHLGHPGALPHLKVLNLATPANSLLAGKVSYSHISICRFSDRMWTSLRGHSSAF